MHTMELIPVKTRVLKPPQDDLAAVLRESLPVLHSGDVVAISSKVIAIDEGRCIKADEVDSKVLARIEAEVVIERPYWGSPLTVKHHSFISAAGIDKSNGNEHLILTPEDPFVSAERWWSWLRDQYTLSEVGVIVVDSRSQPFRYGATGVAIGWWGIVPLKSHVGTPDLFGRPLVSERSNIVDGLAAAANVVMGESNESTPVVVVRDTLGLGFTAKQTREEIFAPYQDDNFRVLYEQHLPKPENSP
jgi:coenzyme F420-0:L-glutamate ligase